MNPVLAALRPFAVRQGTRRVAPLPVPPMPGDGPHGLVVAAGDSQPALPGSGPRQAAARPAARRHLVVVGDELAQGCGTASLDAGLPGQVARAMLSAAASAPGGPCDAAQHGEVVWQVVAEPGADMASVARRLLAQVPADADVVLVAGLADLMARTAPQDFAAELDAVLRQLVAPVGAGPTAPAGGPAHPTATPGHGGDRRQAGRHVVVVGCPPVHRAPLLGWPLTALLDADAARLDAAALRACEQHGAVFVDWRGMELDEGCWLADGYHPSLEQYRQLADRVAATATSGA